MKIETRKMNLINWLSTIQEDEIITKVEKIQKETSDWWDTVSTKDKTAINEGLNQLDKGEFYTRSQVRSKIKDRFNL
jgi:predicted transcriptional regulator